MKRIHLFLCATLASGRSRLSFRSEAFNLLNKTDFSRPNGNRSSAFGSTTSTYPARQLQFTLKLLF